MILNEISKMPGGANRANAFLKQRLDSWVSSAAQGAVAERGDMASELAFNLAGLLEAQGDVASALTMWEAIVPARVERDGEAHEYTLAARGNLAIIRHNQGDWDGAREMYEAVIKGKTELRGADHPSTLRTKSNLAAVLYRAGRVEEALAAYRDVCGVGPAGPRPRPRPTPPHPTPQHPTPPPLQPISPHRTSLRSASPHSTPSHPTRLHPIPSNHHRRATPGLVGPAISTRCPRRSIWEVPSPVRAGGGKTRRWVGAKRGGSTAQLWRGSNLSSGLTTRPRGGRGKSWRSVRRPWASRGAAAAARGVVGTWAAAGFVYAGRVRTAFRREGLAQAPSFH